MKKQNSKYADCFSSYSSAATEMCDFAKTALPTISGASASAIIVIQFSNEIPDAFSCGSSAMVIVSQALKTGRPTFADLFTFIKMDDFPAWDFDAKAHLFHSLESSP